MWSGVEDDADVEAMLEAVLVENAGRYFPDLPPGRVRVECESTRSGRLSIAHFLRVDVGDATRGVVVKRPPEGIPPAISTRRARVAPVLDPKGKFESEARALELVARTFTDRDDPRFGAVRMLDFVPEHEALLTERLSDPTLRELLSPTRRLRPPMRDLSPAFANLGAWLRCYQALEGGAHTVTRHEKRSDFVATTRALVEFADRPWLKKVAEHVVAVAERELPSELSLGLAHGDLAPRNVLVSDTNRVTVLDTRGAWRAPCLEDVGYLLASLWTSRAQAWSLGLSQRSAVLARYERSILRGYFDGGDDDANASVSVRLFELQALFDRYAALLEKAGGSGKRAALRRAGRAASERCLRGRILEVAGALPGGGSK